MQKVKKKVLIFGGSGFIGKNFINKLKKKNSYKILATYSSRKIRNNKNITYTKFNFQNKISNKILNFNPDFVYFFIWENIPFFTFKNCFWNFYYSIKILQQIAKYKSIKKLIISGSCMENFNEFKISNKRNLIFFFLAKNLLRIWVFWGLKNITIYWFKIFFAYGPFQRKESLVPYLINSIQNRKKPILKNRCEKKDYIYVGDVCDLFLRSLSSSADSGIFDVKTSLRYSSYEVTNLVNKIFNYKNRNYHTIKLKTYEKKPLFFLNKFNWKPNTNLFFGIRATINFFKKKYDNN